MTVAYILEQNASVNREGERLLIKKDGAVIHTLHVFKLDQLVLFGNVFLTPAALAYLLLSGIDTVFMSKSGRYRGRLQPPLSKNITLRCEQFKKMEEESFCLATSKAIVEGKITNLRTNLLRLNRTREGLGLDNHILSLKRLGQKVPEAENLDVLRGYEGRSAVVYFEGFSKGFRVEGIEFIKRVRRPPTDPVNALLSLGYTLLLGSVMAAVSLVGFDPYLGCLHSVEYGRPSLALDLMEEWRPVIIDSLVLSIFNLKTITIEDFIFGQVDKDDLQDDEEKDVLEDPKEDRQDSEESSGHSKVLPVKLTEAGFKKFLTQFERKLAEKVRHPQTDQQLSYRDCITEQVRHFARYVRGEEKSYQPMLSR